jgi:hypothetical protein
MKSRYIYTLIIFAIGFILYSCGEDTVKPPVTDDTNKFFPTTINSWWTYTNYELDRDGKKIDESVFSSKYILSGKVDKDGKEASVFDVQDLSGNKIEDSRFYYAYRTQIFEYSKLLPPLDFSLPIDIPMTWYKIADEKVTEWTLFTQKLDNAEFQFGGYSVTLDDTFKVKMKYEGTESVTYGANMDQSVNAKKFKMSYIYGGNAKYSGFPIQIPFTVESVNYYADGIGLVKHVMLPMSITLMNTEFYRMPGSEQVLLEYYIEK